MSRQKTNTIFHFFYRALMENTPVITCPKCNQPSVTITVPACWSDYFKSKYDFNTLHTCHAACLVRCLKSRKRYGISKKSGLMKNHDWKQGELKKLPMSHGRYGGAFGGYFYLHKKGTKNYCCGEVPKSRTRKSKDLIRQL